jgi:hypothetical protein
VVVQYANTTGCAMYARSVVVVQYANTTGSAIIARSAVVVEYANTTGGAIGAKCVDPVGRNEDGVVIAY